MYRCIHFALTGHHSDLGYDPGTVSYTHLGNGQGTENCDAARPFAMNENGSDTLPDEAVTIRELLHKFSGSREKTAQAMGISKATLWRHMKKYGIEKDR